MARVLCAAALIGGLAQIWYLRPRELKGRVIDVCVLTDFEYRLQLPNWEPALEPLFREVNAMFRRTGVQWRIAGTGEAYPPNTQGDMAERAAVAAAVSTCKADVLLILTGRADRVPDSVVPPFGHALIVQHRAADTAAITATVVSRALGNLFGAPGLPRALIITDAAEGQVFDTAAIQLIGRLRDYPFSRGVSALRGAWEARVLAVLTEALKGTGPPPAAAAHRTMARAFAGGLRHEDAARHLREAVRLDPENTEIRLELGMQLYAASQTDEAISELRTVARADPEDALPHALMGAIYLNSGRAEEATDEFRVATALAPRQATYHAALGAALSSQSGRIREATEAFDTAVQLKPSEPGAYAGLAGDREAQVRYEELARRAEEQARRNPQSAEAQVGLSVAYSLAGRFDAATTAAQRALALDPSSGTAHLVLARLDYLNGNYPAAQAEIEAARSNGAEPGIALANAVRRKLGR